MNKFLADMVLNHQKFNFGAKCLIEKIIIQAPFRFRADFRNEACLIYFREGKTIINSPGEQQSIEADEALLLKCGSYFADLLNYPTSKKYEILVFHLYPDILREIYAADVPNFISSSKDKTFIRKISSSDVIKKFAESLQFYFDNPPLVNEELLKLKIKELILLLVQSQYAESIINLFTDLFTPRNLSVKEIVNNHLFSNLSIADLASLSGLSESTFNRTFQSLYNDTPASYMKKKRLERAKELLSISTLTVSEIAYQTCFKDVAHFSRSFKATYHCTPSAFRQSLRRT